MSELSDRQLEAISVIERACSVFSLIGCVFTIVTFSCSKAFHKPINRLVFYASFGNTMTNVGTLMSRTYLPYPNGGACQLQAFLIQMFMPADAFWTLAMAINVYLTFYYKFDAHRLRRMEIPYLIGCYGVPFIPAFVFIFSKNSDGAHAYGNAVLWCWITPEWDIWRIAMFYGPIWVVIIVTFFIYIRAGRTIYEKRQELHQFNTSDPDPTSVNADMSGTFKTTEICVTTEYAGQQEAIGLRDLSRGPPKPADKTNNNVPYSVSISAQQQASENALARVPSHPSRNPAYVGGSTTGAPLAGRKRNNELNNAAWAYTKCSILFFTAILITWIPSSANRVYSLIHTNQNSVPLEFMSAFVLPLQGFWNVLIYIVTSWGACKSLVADIKLGRRPHVADLVGGMRGQDDAHDQPSGHPAVYGSSSRSGRPLETESTTGFARDSDASDDGLRGNSA